MDQELNEQERQAAFEEGTMASLLKKDYARAMECYRRAAELGHPLAAYNLGVLHENGMGTQEDKSKALMWYEKAADLGSTDAQYRCAEMYLSGEGTEKDSHMYLMWLHKAAEQGHAEAAEAWNRLISLDEGSELLASAVLEEGKRAFAKKRYEEAMQRFLEVPEPHRASAEYLLGLMFANGLGAQMDRGNAIFRYEQAAKQGHAEAAFQLGEIYQGGTAADLEQALLWYEKAAELGHARARYHCAETYDKGKGVRADKSKALMWYEKAVESYGKVDRSRLSKAEAAKVTLYYNMSACACAEMYYNGDGTQADKSTALMWYEKAARNGSHFAQQMCAEMYDKGEGTRVDKSMALMWYEKAAESETLRIRRKCAKACAEMYYYGKGTQTDKSTALVWYEIAAEHGDDGAVEMCVQMYKNGEGTAVDKEKARYWKKKCKGKGLFGRL